MLKDPSDYLKDGQRLIAHAGLAVVLDQALDALTSALYVICSTEVEAIEIQRQANATGTDKIREHWRGRAEAAWSIRRHADGLEPAVRLLWRLVPARTPVAKTARDELKKKLKDVKAMREAMRKEKSK